MERGKILVNGVGFSLRARCQGGGCPWPRGWRSTFEAVAYISRWEWWLGAIVWVWGVMESRRNLPEVSITVVSLSLSVRAGSQSPWSVLSFSVSLCPVRSRDPPFAVVCWRQPRSRLPSPCENGVAISGPAANLRVWLGTMLLPRAYGTLDVRDHTVSGCRRPSPGGMVTAGRTPSPARDGGGPSTVWLVGGLCTPLWIGQIFDP